MPEYIEREAAKSYPIRLNHYDKKNGNLDFVLGIESVVEYIGELPAADVVEVKHGEWMPVYYNGKLKGGKCSICGKYKKAYNITLLNKNYQFCHGCGAKMAGGDNNV